MAYLSIRENLVLCQILMKHKLLQIPQVDHDNHYKEIQTKILIKNNLAKYTKFHNFLCMAKLV